MSLKSFHIFFIIVSILLALGLGIGAFSAHPLLGIAAFAAAGGLGYYLGWFICKLKRLG